MTQQTEKQMWITTAELMQLATRQQLAFIMSFLCYPFVFSLSSAKESISYDSLSGGVTQSSFLGNLNAYRLCLYGVRIYLLLTFITGHGNLRGAPGIPLWFTEIALSAYMDGSSLL